MKMHGRQLVLDYSFAQQPNHRRVMRLVRELAYTPVVEAPKPQRRTRAERSAAGDFVNSLLSDFATLSTAR